MKIKIQLNGRLHFSLIIFLVCLLFTFRIWDFYFNSKEIIDQTITANLILLMGILFSIAAGLFAWSLEARHADLEKEVLIKSQELIRKNQETKKAEVASAAIYQSCHILFSEIRLSGLLKTVMDLMSKVLYADEGSLMLLDSKSELFIAASRGIPEDVARLVHLKIGERVAGRVAQLQREFLIVDGLDKYPEFKGVEANSRIRSAIVCPLMCQNEFLGVLNLNRTVTKENFTVADMINVSIFSAQVAQALRNASLYQALEKKVMELEETHKQVKVLQDQLSQAS